MAKRNNQNAKRRSGLSRKDRQKLLRLTRYPRSFNSLKEQSVISYDEARGGIVIRVRTIDDNQAPRWTDRRLQRMKTGKQGVLFPDSHTSIIASHLVKSSSRSVLSGLAIKLLEAPQDIELVHTVGRLVASRAVSMAREYALTRGVGRSGRLGVKGIIDSIGSTGLDMEISPSGKVSAVVTSKASSSKGRKSSKSRKGKSKTSSAGSRPATSDSSVDSTVGASPAQRPRTDDDDAKIEVGHKQVIKHSDGSTTIHIDQLSVYITVVQNDTMIVSPKVVNYDVAKHEPQLLSAISRKKADEVVEEEKEEKDADKKEDGKEEGKTEKKEDEK